MFKLTSIIILILLVSACTPPTNMNIAKAKFLCNDKSLRKTKTGLCRI